MIEKLRLSLLAAIGSFILLVSLILGYFYIGLTIIGIWGISKFYLPLAIIVILIDKIFNKNLNIKNFYISIILLIVYTALLFIESMVIINTPSY